MVKKRKLRWFGHVSRCSDLAKTILRGHSERKKKEEESDRRRDGKTISQSGQEWTLPAQLGKLKTGQDGKVIVACIFLPLRQSLFYFKRCENATLKVTS